MAVYRKVKNMFISKNKDEDGDEKPLTRQDLEELEKIIRASKEALFGLKKKQTDKQKTNKERNERRRGLEKQRDKPRNRDNMDQTTDLEDDSVTVDDEDLAFLESADAGTNGGHGGIAFEVDLEPARRVKAKPKELHQEIEPKSLVEYSSDEKALMAEIIREDFLIERSHKAAQVEIKRYDASRRRLVMTADATARAVQRQNEAAAEHARANEERSRRLKKLEGKVKDDSNNNKT